MFSLMRTGETMPSLTILFAPQNRIELGENKGILVYPVQAIVSSSLQFFQPKSFLSFSIVLRPGYISLFLLPDGPPGGTPYSEPYGEVPPGRGLFQSGWRCTKGQGRV